MFMANSTFSVLRGTMTDAYGDPKDSEQPVQTGIPGSVMEVRSVITTVSEGRGQQIRLLVGRLPAQTNVRHGDRLRDERTGHIYIIDAIDPTAQSAILDSGVRLDLRRVT